MKHGEHSAGHVMNHSGGEVTTTMASVLHSVATTVVHSLVNDSLNVSDGNMHMMNSHHHAMSGSTSMDMHNHHNMHDMSGHGGDGSMGPMMNHSMMKMYFHTGLEETVLFYEWKINTIAGLVVSMIGIFLMALLYEGLKFFREHLFKKYASAVQYSSVAVIGQDGKVVEEMHKIASNRICTWPHVVQTLLHVLQVVISYCLMLIFMTYNVWLCLAVALGAGAGYFIFGWRKATVVDVTEHCH